MTDPTSTSTSASTSASTCPSPQPNSPSRSRSPVPIKTNPNSIIRHSHSNSQQFSLSPSSNPSDLDDTYTYNYQDDHDHDHDHDHELDHSHQDPEEVFSNPDTDGTGATSPGPNSPGPSSPLRNSTLFSSNANDLNLQKLNFSSSNPTIDPTPSSTSSILNLNPSSTPTKPTNPRDGHHSTLKGRPVNSPLSTSPTLVKSGTQSPTSPIFHTNHPSNSNQSSQLLPSANELPSDPKEASSLSQLFAHQPDTTCANNSPVQTFAAGISTPLSTTSAAGLPSHSPILSHKNLRSSRPTTRPSSPERMPNERLGSISPTSLFSSTSPFRNQTATTTSSSSPSLSRLQSGTGSIGNPSSTKTPSIFERDIEHRDASHVLTKSEAIDVAIPNVLDDAAEAIVEDTTEQLEIVAPHLSPPVALSARALSAHSEHSSPSLGSPANSSSPPLSQGGQSGDMNPPPGSVAAQIAERLMGGGGNDAIPSSSRSKGHRRPISDATSSAGSFRSRSPHAMGGRGVQQVLDTDAGTSSPPLGGNSTATAALSHSNVSAFSKNQSHGAAVGSSNMSRSVTSGEISNPGSNSPLPIATAFPSLPLPNPYRSSSPEVNRGSSNPNLAGSNTGLGFGTPSSSISNLPLDLDSSRPAVSSLSIDGAVISGNEVASASASLGGIADAISQSNSEDSNLSPYTGKRTPSNFSPEIPSSPVLQRSSNQPSIGHSKNPSTSSQGMLNPQSAGGGLGVFDGGESESTPTSSEINSSTMRRSNPENQVAKQKHRLSFFSYADIINQAEPELLDFKEAVKSSCDADELQHGIHSNPNPQESDYGYGYSTNPNPSSSFLNSVGMERSASSGSAIHYSIGPANPSATREIKSGSSTPLRGRKTSASQNRTSNSETASQFLNHQSLETKLLALKEPR